MFSHSAVEIGEQRRLREAMDSLIGEITKGSDDSVASSLRMALERGWRNSIMDALKDAKKRKDLEISKITNRHYPEFQSSVKDMLTLQPTASELLGLIVAVNKDSRSVRDEMVSISNELSSALSEADKVHIVLEASLKCRKVVEKMVKARECIDSHNHYQAMHSLNAINKDLEELVQQGSGSIKPLTQYLGSWLPYMTFKLLDTVRVDSQESIQTARLDNFLIGQTILRKFANQLSEEMSGDLPAQTSKARLTTVNPSLSIMSIYSCSAMLRFEYWVQDGQLDSIVPSNFIDGPSDNGVYLVNQGLAPKLSSIYKAVHIHYKLKQQRAYDEFYRTSRDTFLPHIFEEAEEMAGYQGLASIMPNLIASIAGFLYIECTLWHGIKSQEHKTRETSISKKAKGKSKHSSLETNTNSVFSETELAIVWDRTVGYLHAFIVRHIKLLSTPEQILQIKEELILLGELVSDDLFRLRPQGVYEIIRSMWPVFESLQIRSVTSSVNYLLKQCAFQPFYVSSELQYQTKIKAYKLDSINIDQQVIKGANGSPTNKSNPKAQARVSATLDALEADIGLISHTSSIDGSGAEHSDSFISQTFPFSEAVSDIVREIHVAITNFFLFATKNPHLGSRGETLCTAIKKVYDSVANVLQRQLTIDGADTPLSKACQISIDAAAFAQTTDLIFQIMEPMLEKFRWSESADVHLPFAINSAKTRLIQISIQAQDVIFDLLAKKIEDLLGSLVFVNFTPRELGPGYTSITHEPIDEIIDFLKITFLWLTHLPQSVRDTANFTCCTKVANGILGFLLSDNVTAINLFCFVILSNDVKKLIQFANSSGIKRLDSCFQELQDTIKIVLNAELPELVANISQRKALYPKLNIKKLVVILEKLVPTPVGAAQMNLPHIDKGNMKALVKKLRSQFPPLPPK